MSIALLGGFACFAGFESSIAGVERRAETGTVEIAAARKALRLNRVLDELDRRIAQRAGKLRLFAGGPSESAAILDEVGRLATARSLSILGIRNDNVAIRNDKAPGLRRRAYNVVFEGTYPNAVGAIADFAHARLVATVDRVSFERARRQGISTKAIRATFQITVYGLDAEALR